MATFEELEASEVEALKVLRGSVTDTRAVMLEELQRALEDGEGIDGRALELVQAMLELPGEHFNDGECLDFIGDVIDAWRAIED
jgi:hypothetical protein